MNVDSRTVTFSKALHYKTNLYLMRSYHCSLPQVFTNHSKEPLKCRQFIDSTDYSTRIYFRVVTFQGRKKSLFILNDST